jgi:hypothetical protein
MATSSRCLSRRFFHSCLRYGERALYRIHIEKSTHRFRELRGHEKAPATAKCLISPSLNRQNAHANSELPVSVLSLLRILTLDLTSSSRERSLMSTMAGVISIGQVESTNPGDTRLA